MSTCKKFFVIAGEQSGDNHASSMFKKLARHCAFELYGTGGRKLAELGQVQYYSIDELSVIGLDGILKKLPFLFKVRDDLLEKLDEVKPDAVLLVDYPGFNLRFAKKIREKGIPVIFFIAPQVWAWNYKRVNTIRECVDLLLCILPFEEELFKKEGINARFIGNPIVDSIELKYTERDSFLEDAGLDPSKKIIGLLPGSRFREVDTLLPVMLKSAENMGEDYQFIVSKASSVPDEKIMEHLRGKNFKVAELTYDIMKHADLLWICSGTATLEAAVLGTPMVVLYKVGIVSQIIGKIVLKIKFLGLPNLIAGRGIVPECLQEDLVPSRIIDSTEKVFGSYETVKSDLERVAEPFIGLNPSEKAAWEIYSFLSEREKLS